MSTTDPPQAATGGADDADLRMVVSARTDGSPPPGGVIGRVLTSTIAGLEGTTDRHTVWWPAEAWGRASVLDGAVSALLQPGTDDPRWPGWRRITRNDVFTLGSDSLDLFLGAMAHREDP